MRAAAIAILKRRQHDGHNKVQNSAVWTKKLAMLRIGVLERLRSTRASNTALIERVSSFSACNVPDESQADRARSNAEKSRWRAQRSVDFKHALVMSLT